MSSNEEVSSDSVEKNTPNSIVDPHFLRCCRVLAVAPTHKRVTPRASSTAWTRGQCSRNRFVQAECAKKCAWAKLLPPEPAPYRACLSGCERGATAGVKLGCEERSTAESCEAHIKDECEDDTAGEQSEGHCKHLHSEAEGIRNMCRQGCAKGSRSACTRTAEIVERRRKQDISMNEFAEL